MPAARRTMLVFVKAPSPGGVKTRLVPPLSPEQAARLYRTLARDTVAVAKKVPRADVVLAYAGNEEFPDCSWLDQQLPMVNQQGRDLGDRLAQAFRWAFARRACPAAAIGSDAPGLSASWLRRALEELEEADVVLGPTTDGGYHLIGLRQARPALFKGMPWSTGRLLAATRKRIESLGLIASYLPSIRDLDTPEDLRYFRKRLKDRVPRPVAQHVGPGRRAHRR